jgi:hypothetical protein
MMRQADDKAFAASADQRPAEARYRTARAFRDGNGFG